MRDKIKDKIIFIQYLALAITLAVMIVRNIERSRFWLMILLTAFFLFSFSIRNLFLYSFDKYGKLCRLMVLADIVTIFVITCLDAGGSSIVLYYVLISDASISFSAAAGFFTAILAYFGYLINVMTNNKSGTALEFTTAMLKGLVPFMAIYAFLYVVKYIMKQNETIDAMLKKLTEKTLEQDLTLQELREAYEKQEDITILKERNKIAREIHDTLGHTLTTVLVETEAGKILVGRDKSKAMEKFELAQEQLRKGLDDLRLSVRILDKGDELVDFKTSLETLIKDTEKHTGVIIKHEISLAKELDKALKKALYRALQEGITNGIKHGGSTAFVFKLHEAENGIEFLLQDNGKGCSAVIPGFGLRAMQERLKELGGSVDFESEPDEGFTLKIDIRQI